MAGDSPVPPSPRTWASEPASGCIRSIRSATSSSPGAACSRSGDTRLDRSVAIKIVPDQSLRERFEREAKTISSLNHPNICSLYDVGDSYIVMEYIEGESLADRLEKGPLPIDQVLRMGSEIASA